MNGAGSLFWLGLRCFKLIFDLSLELDNLNRGLVLFGLCESVFACDLKIESNVLNFSIPLVFCNLVSVCIWFIIGSLPLKSLFLLHRYLGGIDFLFPKTTFGMSGCPPTIFGLIIRKFVLRFHVIKVTRNFLFCFVISLRNFFLCLKLRLLILSVLGPFSVWLSWKSLLLFLIIFLSLSSNMCFSRSISEYFVSRRTILFAILSDVRHLGRLVLELRSPGCDMLKIAFMNMLVELLPDFVKVFTSYRLLFVHC
ncbi:unnamed protein product [Moneuplotes crassus]|uniref:Uncharacterized protein n=1 Tax=Euplotes crassus TaxID=5936 RepID=A0AAD1XRR0_EUPCR|nr:unnamed protein product [Moneuplotes crassus]